MRWPKQLFEFIRKKAAKKKLGEMVSSGPRLKGNLLAKGPGIFRGALTGDFTAEQEVVILPPGIIEGNLKGLEFAVGGTVRGNIEARLGTSLLRSADVRGNIQAHSFQIETGAEFSGVVSIGLEEKEPLLNLKSKR